MYEDVAKPETNHVLTFQHTSVSDAIHGSPHIMGHEIWYCPRIRVLVNHAPSCIPVDDSPPGLVHRGIAC